MGGQEGPARERRIGRSQRDEQLCMAVAVPVNEVLITGGDDTGGFAERCAVRTSLGNVGVRPPMDVSNVRHQVPHAPRGAGRHDRIEAPVWAVSASAIPSRSSTLRNSSLSTAPFCRPEREHG